MNKLELLEYQNEQYREALNDIVHASRDKGLASMINWMRDKAITVLKDMYTLEQEHNES